MNESAPILAPRHSILSPEGYPLPPAPSRPRSHQPEPKRERAPGKPLWVRVMASQVIDISNAKPPPRRRWCLLCLLVLAALLFYIASTWRFA